MPKSLAIICNEEGFRVEPGLAGNKEPSIAITGPVGVGKSTLMYELRRRYCAKRKVPCLGEPVPIWIVNLYYTNPKAYAALFQGACISSLGFVSQMYTMAGLGYLIERQGYDAVLFSELLLDNQQITRVIFDQISTTVRTQLVQTDYSIILMAGYLTCHQRIQKRNRKGEEGVPISFCKDLNSKYIDFYVRNFDPRTVFIILAEGTPNEVTEATIDTLNHIRCLQVQSNLWSQSSKHFSLADRDLTTTSTKPVLWSPCNKPSKEISSPGAPPMILSFLDCASTRCAVLPSNKELLL